MKDLIPASILVLLSVLAGTAQVGAAEPRAANHGITLSPDLLQLLRDEMREVAGGVQGIAVAIATGDWQSIQEASAKMRASYIMERKLTPGQARELEAALPEQFKRLDAGFHQRAEKLGAAAQAHDAELVAFQYARLLETCADCHAEFAGARFPALSPAMNEPRHH